MPDPNLIFNPPEGFNDGNVFVTNPANQAETRTLFQRLFTQIQTFINTTLMAWINTTLATKAELAGIALGLIPNDSLTEAQMANEMKKSVVGGVESFNTANLHRTDGVIHVTSTDRTAWNGKQPTLGFTPENISNKNVINGYVGLDANGKISSAQYNGAHLFTKGTWIESGVTTLAVGGNYTKTIPIGFAGTRGIVYLKVGNGLAIIYVGSNTTDMLVFGTEYNVTSASLVPSASNKISFTATAIGCLDITQAYISGTNLMLSFHNNNNSTYTLANVKCAWEVEG